MTESQFKHDLKVTDKVQVIGFTDHTFVVDIDYGCEQVITEEEGGDLMPYHYSQLDILHQTANF